MNKNNLYKIFTLLFNVLLIITQISCSNAYNQGSPQKYSSTFNVGGFYVRYDGVHYKFVCASVNDVKKIIKYYYPDCFDIIVYNPGTEQTGYLNTIFYATWKSYLDYVQIR